MSFETGEILGFSSYVFSDMPIPVTRYLGYPGKLLRPLWPTLGFLWELLGSLGLPLRLNSDPFATLLDSFVAELRLVGRSLVKLATWLRCLPSGCLDEWPPGWLRGWLDAWLGGFLGGWFDGWVENLKGSLA